MYRGICKRSLGFAAMVLCMTLLSMGCSNPSKERQTTSGQTQVVEPYSKDEIVIIHGQVSFANLDPQGATGTTLASVLNNMFDYMVVKTDTGYEPSLAKSWEQQDKVNWIFHLRNDVVFHNGEKFNAEVMKYTMDRAMRADIQALNQANFSTIERVEVVDPYTLRIITKVEDPLLLGKVSAWAARAVPPAYIAQIGEAAFALSPVGTGPYKFVRCDAGRDLYMEYADTYWGPAPSIKKAHWRVVAETGARMAELQAGTADIVDAVPYDLIDRINADPSIEVLNSWSIRTVYLQLDCEVSPTNNKLVRQAVALSIDMDSLIDDLLLGNGRRMASYSIPGVNYHNPDLKPWAYDVNAAKQLIAQTGLAAPIPLTFDVVVGRIPMDKELCEAITGMLNDTGLFKVNMIINEAGVYSDKYNKKGLPRTIGQIILSTHGNHTYDPDFTLTRSFVYIDPPRNMLASHQSNKEWDSLIRQAGVETNDAKRRELNYQLQQLIMEDAPRIYLYQQRSTWGINAHVNWAPTGEMLDLWTISWK